MVQVASYPWLLKPANKVLMVFFRLGVPIGTQRILAIPGRKTGKTYTFTSCLSNRQFLG
jgi:hypothetical protein